VVRAAGYGHNQYGVKLMQRAFASGRDGAQLRHFPTLRWNLKSVALMNLFAGAIGYIMNPLSHRELDIDDARIAAVRSGVRRFSWGAKGVTD
jgi:hypothetical protein